MRSHLRLICEDPDKLSARDYDIVGDGIHDDGPGLQSMLADANSAAVAGRGAVECELFAGTFLTSQTLVLHSLVALVGAGKTASILKLADGANRDILNSDQFATLTGTDTSLGIHHFAIRNLCIDGNRANNTSSGYGIRIYGYSGVIEDIVIRSTRLAGLWSEWGSGALSGSTPSQLVSWVNRFTIHDCGGWGMIWRGPHDGYITDGEVYRNGQVDASKGNIQVTGFGSASHFKGVHVWGASGGNNFGFLIQSQSFFEDCAAEGSSTANVYISASATTWLGGNVFTGSGADLIGVIIDGAANYTVDTQTIGLDNGAIDFASDDNRAGDGGNGLVRLAHSGGAKVVRGTPAATTVVTVQAPETATYDSPASVWFARGFRSAVKDNGQAGCLTGPDTGSGMTAASITANRAYFRRWVAPRDMVITKIAIGVAVAGSNDNIDVGIFDISGTLLGASGSTASMVNSAGTKALTLTTTVNVKAGQTYYVAMAYGPIGGTAANILGLNGATPSATWFGATVGVLEMFRLDTLFPLATTASFTGFALNGAVPLFALRES